MSHLLELRGLKCVRAERTLFRGIDARLEAGRLLRVQGPNGAGKTTLLRMICGLIAPDRGEVLWHGRPIAVQREQFQRRLIYLGHAAALKDNLSAVENLQAAARIGGLDCTLADAALALAQAGLRGREWLPPRLLSQGQRRRVALARLALPRPEGAVAAAATLWVLDEPFNALDDEAGRWLVGLITRHLGRGGVAVLTSHQDVTFGAGVAQTVIAL